MEPVTDERGAAAIAHVERVGFGSEREIAERFYAPASYGVEGVRSFVAFDADEPVGMVAAYLHEGAIGIFGVAVVPAARRRGIASALSVIAARAFPADLAWLHTDDATPGPSTSGSGSARSRSGRSGSGRTRSSLAPRGVSGAGRILARVTVLGGEPAVPCTRNPLLRG